MLYALIRKELREHRRLAAAALGVSLLLVAAVARSEAVTYATPVADHGILGPLAAICAVYGAVLGYAQSWHEELRRTWPFLLHLPVGRGRILAAKLAAGALLYFVPTGLAALLIALISSVPGRYPAPFVLHDLLWPVQALWSGYALLLGVFALGLWRSPVRWIGFAGPIALLLAPATIPATWPIAGAALLFATLLALAAAWHVIGGAPRARVALALVLAAAATGILLVADVLAVQLLPRGEWRGASRSVRFGLDGEPMVEVQEWNALPRLETLDGRVIAPRVAWNDERRWGTAGLPVWPVRPWSPLLRERAVSFAAWGVYPPGEGWYVDRASGLVIGYDLETRRPAVFVGRDGPADGRAGARAFPPILGAQPEGGPGTESRLLLLTEGGLYRLTRGVEGTAVRRISGALVRAINTGVVRAREGGVENVHLVRTSDAIGKLRLGAAEATWFRLPEDARGDPLLWATPIAEDVLGLIVQRHDRATNETVFDLRKIDPAGAVLWRREVRLPDPPRDRPEEMLYGLVPGLHPLSLAYFFALRPDAGREIVESARRGLRENPAAWWQAAVLVTLFLARCLACAAAAFVWLGGRGLSRARRLGWTAFAFLAAEAGLAALAVTLLAERRAPCPGCGRPRAPSTETCERCGAPWPAPAPREIDLLGAPAPAAEGALR